MPILVHYKIIPVLGVTFPIASDVICESTNHNQNQPIHFDSPTRFMSIPRCFTFEDGSALVSEHQQGTLLDVVNATASKRMLHEAVAVFFLVEMLGIARRLRELQVIHGDIKPDNFLLLDM